jgi:hypothetical protein
VLVTAYRESAPGYGLLRCLIGISKLISVRYPSKQTAQNLFGRINIGAVLFDHHSPTRLLASVLTIRLVCTRFFTKRHMSYEVQLDLTFKRNF